MHARVVSYACWTAGIGGFVASLLFAWFDLDHEQFDDYYTRVWALMGAGVTGSGLFLAYLAAVPALAALALAAHAGERHRRELRAAVATIAVPLIAILVLASRPAPVAFGHGDSTPVTVYPVLDVAIAVVALISLSAFIGEHERGDASERSAEGHAPVRAWPITVPALVLSVAGYVLAFHDTWARIGHLPPGTDRVTYHATATPVGSVFLLSGLAVVGLAAATCAAGANSMRAATLVTATGWLAVALAILLTPRRLTPDRLPPGATVHLGTGLLMAAVSTALAAGAAALSEARFFAGPPRRLETAALNLRSGAVLPLSAWAAGAGCFVAMMFAPWGSVPHASSTGPVASHVGLFAVGHGYPSQAGAWLLVATPILLALSLLAWARPSRAITLAAVTVATTLLLADLVLIIAPSRLILPSPGSVSHQAVLAGLSLSLATTLLAGVPVAIRLRAIHGHARTGRAGWAMMLLALAAYVVAVAATWMHARVVNNTGGGDDTGGANAFTAPQGLIVLLGGAALLALAATLLVSTSATARLALIGLAIPLLAFEILLAVQPWWMVNGGLIALTVPRPWVHATLYPGAYAMLLLAALALVIAARRPPAVSSTPELG